MRDLLQYPFVNLMRQEEVFFVLKEMSKCKPEGVSYKSEVADAGKQQELLILLGKLTGKVFSMAYLDTLMQQYALDVLPLVLLQPKPPAVFDITVDEVAEVLVVLLDAQTMLHQKIYYKELLQKSLLLSDIDDYLPCENISTLMQNDIMELACRLHAAGSEGAKIITF